MLTQKEIEVLQLRKKGLTQIEVAMQLKISQSAVCSFEKNAHNKILQAQEIVNFARLELKKKTI